jgi:uncharacterized membrane protein
MAMKSLTLATMSGTALWVIISGGTLAQAHRTAAVESIVTIDVPGARSTTARGINDHGDVVGAYDSHGFLLKDGVFTSFDAPDATCRSCGTSAMSINNRGDIVGSYAPQEPNLFLSFLLRDGVFTTIELLISPKSNLPPILTGRLVGVTGINERGDIVGNYYQTCCFSFTASYGFLLDHRGAFSNISYPPTEHLTFATGINARGDIVGYYYEDEGPGYGFFVRHRDGVFTFFDLPFGRLGIPTGINARGEIVGYYDVNPPRGSWRSFLRDQYGNLTAVDVPGALGTLAYGINDRGDIVGSYTDADGSHGFVAHRGDGEYGDGDHDDGDHGRGGRDDHGRGAHGKGDPRPGMISYR